MPLNVDSQIDEFYVSRIEASRKAKTKKFIRKRSSPLKDIKAFKGFNYYEIDTNFVFQAEILPHSTSSKMEFETSSGVKRTYVDYGKLIFSYQEEEYSLTIYQAVDRKTKKQ